MLHHVEIYVSDLEASHVFWSGILAKIGYEEAGRWSDGFTLRRDDDAYLTFVQVADKYRALSYHRCGVGLNHLAFRVESRALVDELLAYCRANGIATLYDATYPFANGGHDYYALYVEDPDRMKVEFVAAD